jgi:hypothetical protein
MRVSIDAGAMFSIAKLGHPNETPCPRTVNEY